MTISITLSKGYVAIVDDCDKDLAELRWSAVVRPDGKQTYGLGYPNKKQQYIHRVILSRMLGRELAHHDYVDHINGDGLDNRRSNLRLADQKTNRGNANKHKVTATSPYKGVQPSRAAKRPWKASIFIDGKSKSLRSHKTAELAHRAYCIAAIRYWGEWANFGDNSPFKGMTLQQILSWNQTDQTRYTEQPIKPFNQANQSLVEMAESRLRVEPYEPFVMPNKEWLEPLPESKTEHTDAAA